MSANKILTFLLLLTCLCHVASAAKPERITRTLQKSEDWRPHFGYVHGHMASEHKMRGNRNNNSDAEPKDDKKLKDYVVRLVSKNKMICSGLVVNMQTVLTAKICLDNRQLADIVVKLTNGTSYKVIGSTDANDYTVGNATKLLTLLKLERKLEKKFKKAPPICERFVKPTDNVELWNWDKSKTTFTKNPARQLPKAECKKLLKDSIASSSISCVENTKKTKKCEKTYGLPYVWKGSFCGMNLLGHNCPMESSADVFVRLLKEKLYISNSIKEVNKAHVEDFIV